MTNTTQQIPKQHGFALGVPLVEELRQLWRNGYQPLPLSNKIPRFKNWQNIEIDAPLIEQWCSQKPRTLGIRTGEVVGVDIDVLDESLSDQMAALAVTHLGESSFIRVGKHPKQMLFYRTNGDAVSKSMTSFYVNGDPDVKHRVEILGAGQQSAVIGVHSPERLYQWPKRCILNYPMDELPEVSETVLGEFLDACTALFESSGYTVVENTNGGGEDGNTVRDLTFETKINGVTVGEIILGKDTDFRCSAVDFREGATNESSLHITKTGLEIIVQDYGTGLTHLLPKDDDTEEQMGELAVASIEQSGGTSPVDRYIYIESENKYFVTDQYGCIGKEAINTIHRATHRGGQGGTPLIANWLPLQSGFRTAWGLTWYPCKYGNEKKYQTIQLGSHEMANTWEGFALTPVKGDVKPWLRHLKHVVPDKGQRKNVIRRLAFDIQKPWKKCNWHLVIWGIPGAGKDALITPLAQMFGNAASTVGNKDAKSDYDDGFVKRKLVTISEVKGLRGDALEEMKRKAASENVTMMTLNPKKEAKITQANLWSMVFITNHRDAMKLSPDERRFYVLNASKVMTEVQMSAYFEGWLNKENDGGAAKLMDFLLRVDLAGFNKNVVPEKTPQFYDMIDATNTDMESTLQDWGELCSGLFSYDFVNPVDVCKELKDHNISVRQNEVRKYMMDKGWVKIYADRDKRIFKKGRGYKSTKYLVRYDSEFIEGKVSVVWDAIDEEEAKRLNDQVADGGISGFSKVT